MNKEKVIPRALEYDVYRIYCADSDYCHRELEMETKIKFAKNDNIIIGFEDIEYSCIVIDGHHTLRKHRISDTVSTWKYEHRYILRESVCQEKRESELTAGESKGS